MRMMTKFFGISMALIAFAVTAPAQTVAFNGIGSSAQFLQLGLAAGSATTANPVGLGATCVWSQKSTSAGALEATDPTNSLPETGNAWIAWTPESGSCTTVNSSTVIYAMLQTDSVIGNRCFFNKCTMGAASSPVGTTPDGLIFTSGEVDLPAAVWDVLDNLAVTAAATDIRPEDAKFATLRGLTNCNAPLASGSQYLGLGYNNATPPSSQPQVLSYYSNSTFNVTTFTLPVDGSYTVIPLGAVPIVVAVNPTDASGFGASGVTNITHAQLAKFLDGSYGKTSDITGGGTANATVLVREPLSGTYNTMEYSIPNSTTDTYGGYDLQTSQDVGLTEPAAQKNCSGTSPITTTNVLGTSGYVMHIASADNASGFRNRVIGTGQAVSELLATTDSLGYSFWSTANFAAATSSNARYLTVDGVDPLMTSYSNGEIPTASNGLLTDVNFAHLQDGTYPIWSLLRLVTETANPEIAFVRKLAATAQGFVSTTNRPDFVPFSNNSSKIGELKVFHSHFAPTGVNFYSPLGSNVPANGTSAYTPAATNCSAAEAGGDVGGAIGGVTTVLGALPESDESYCSGTGSTAGQTGYRK